MESFNITRHLNVRGIESFYWKRKIRKEIVLELPTEWADLTQEQFEIVASVLFSELKEPEAMAELFVKLSGLRSFELALLSNDDIYTQMVPCFDFIKTPICIAKPLIKWIPEKYYGPKDDLDGLCWKQFSLAEHICNQFRISKDMELLDKLACILYCSESEFTNKEIWRKGLSDPYQGAMMEVIKTIPLALKQAIYMNYIGLKANLIKEEMFPKLFPSSSSPSANSSSKGTDEPIDWHAVSISLAGEKFGTIDDLYFTAVHDVMKFLDMQNESTTTNSN